MELRGQELGWVLGGAELQTPRTQGPCGCSACGSAGLAGVSAGSPAAPTRNGGAGQPPTPLSTRSCRCSGLCCEGRRLADLHREWRQQL